MIWDELAVSNDCCASSESDCLTTSRTSCMTRASLFGHYDDSDKFEDSLWVV
jgi:hypothetical protein